MRLNLHAASSIASALPSFRLALVFGGVLALTESVVLATTLFAGAGISLVASLLIAAVIYRRRGPRPTDARHDGAPVDAAVS